MELVNIKTKSKKRSQNENQNENQDQNDVISFKKNKTDAEFQNVLDIIENKNDYDNEDENSEESVNEDENSEESDNEDQYTTKQKNIVEIYYKIFPGKGKIGDINRKKITKKLKNSSKNEIKIECKIWNYIFKKRGQPPSLDNVVKRFGTNWKTQYKNKTLIFFHYQPYYGQKWKSIELWDTKMWNYVNKNFAYEQVNLGSLSGKHSEDHESLANLISKVETNPFEISLFATNENSNDDTVLEYFKSNYEREMECIGEIGILYKCTCKLSICFEIISYKHFKFIKEDQPNLKILLDQLNQKSNYETEKEKEISITCFNDLDIIKTWRNPKNIIKFEDKYSSIAHECDCMYNFFESTTKEKNHYIPNP